MDLYTSSSLKDRKRLPIQTRSRRAKERESVLWRANFVCSTVTFLTFD